MELFIQIIIVGVIVGAITAGLNIKFDRFFTILLFMFIMSMSIVDAVNTFLYVILFGAMTVLVMNREKLKSIPAQNKKKFLTIIPLITGIFSFLGTYLFLNISSKALMIIFGILVILYGLRMVFVHFDEKELKYIKGNPKMQKFCGFFGPMVSGFFIGLLSTSVKSLKIPFAVKFGKLNIQQVYIGNVITAFFSSAFAILWHIVLGGFDAVNLFLGFGVWGAIHATFVLVNGIFPSKWSKGFQIIIGIALLLVSIKVFALI